jgi:hypothetical protein
MASDLGSPVVEAHRLCVRGRCLARHECRPLRKGRGGAACSAGRSFALGCVLTRVFARAHAGGHAAACVVCLFCVRDVVVTRANDLYTAVSLRSVRSTMHVLSPRVCRLLRRPFCRPVCRLFCIPICRLFRRQLLLSGPQSHTVLSSYLLRHSFVDCFVDPSVDCCVDTHTV